MTERSLLLVGCGKMGSSMLAQWRKKRPAELVKLYVIEPHNEPPRDMKSMWVATLKFLPKNVRPNIIVFAVKPQQLASILPSYRRRFGERPLYISIAAGKPIGFFAGHLGKRARIVRAMPNTPALVGESMTVLCAPPSLAAGSKKIATELMSAIGQVAWVKDEAMMDAVTALSGSGPAYVFLFMESLINAAVKAGLPEATARQLAIQMVRGSCALADASRESFETLRDQVTSRGGTTEAALKVLLENGQFESLIDKAIQAAVARSKGL